MHGEVMDTPCKVQKAMERRMQGWCCGPFIAFVTARHFMMCQEENYSYGTADDLLPPRDMKGTGKLIRALLPGITVTRQVVREWSLAAAKEMREVVPAAVRELLQEEDLTSRDDPSVAALFSTLFLRLPFAAFRPFGGLGRILIEQCGHATSLDRLHHGLWERFPGLAACTARLPALAEERPV